MPQTGNTRGSTLYIDSHDNISRSNILANRLALSFQMTLLDTGVDNVDDCERR